MENKRQYCDVEKIELIENYGLKNNEIRYALLAIEKNKEIIIQRWNEYFKK
ncbi:MAG: hypothetical protein ACRC0A_02015 [Chitinophagaceae bacterium]